MFRSPFDEIASPPVQIEYEEVGGQFTCQERGCWKNAKVAKYITKEKVLTWQCPDGHTSYIEGFEL